MACEDSTLSYFDETDRSFYHDNDKPPRHCEEVRKLFQEVFRSLRPLTEVARKVKNDIERDLRKLKINYEDFADFKLGTMEVLMNLKTSSSIEVFVKTALNGFIDGRLCSDIVAKTSPDKQMVRRFNEIVYIMNELLKVLGLSPDVAEKMRFMEFETKLVPYTEQYLEGKQHYETLRHHLHLIKNFQIMNEIVGGLRGLHNVLEQKMHTISCRVPQPTEEFALHAWEMSTTMVTPEDEDLVYWLSSV